MIKKLLLITLLTLSVSLMLQAKTFSYKQVKSMPLSVEKDYYIWRFLNQRSTTRSEAKAIIRDAKYLNKKLKESYRRKTGLKASIPKRKAPPRRASKSDWKAKSNANIAFQYGIKMVERNHLGKAAQYFNGDCIL